MSKKPKCHAGTFANGLVAVFLATHYDVKLSPRLDELLGRGLDANVALDHAQEPVLPVAVREQAVSENATNTATGKLDAPHNCSSLLRRSSLMAVYGVPNA